MTWKESCAEKKSRDKKKRIMSNKKNLIWKERDPVELTYDMKWLRCDKKRIVYNKNNMKQKRNHLQNDNPMWKEMNPVQKIQYAKKLIMCKTKQNKNHVTTSESCPIKITCDMRVINK